MTQSLVTIFDLLSDTAKCMTDQTFIDGKQPISYGEAYVLVNRMANYLHQILPPKNSVEQRVLGIYAEKSFMTVLLPFAVTALGDIFVNINENYTAKYIDYVIRDTSMQLLLFDRKKCNIIDQIQITCRHIDLDEVMLATKDEVNDCRQFPCTNIIDGQASTIYYTSGSTGMPKGIVIPHHSLMDGSKVVTDFLGMQSSDRVMSVLPYSFDYGFNQILISVRVGARLCLHNYLFPNHLLNDLRERKITNLAATPSLWNNIYKFASSHSEMFKGFSALRRITSTGGAISDKVWTFLLEWSKRDDFQFFPMYGLSEAFRSTYLDPKYIEEKCGSIGKPVPGVDIQIMRENLTVCEIKEVGEIVHRGKFISNGYLNNSEANFKVFRDDPLSISGALPNRVVFSGDLGYCDEDGFLYCLGRKDDQVKIRDYRVNAYEIEAEINAIDFVVNSKLLVFYEGELQEPVLRAFVIFSGSQTNEQETFLTRLQQSLKLKLPNYAQPKTIHVLDHFPMNANFKVDCEKLRQNFIESKGG